MNIVARFIAKVRAARQHAANKVRFKTQLMEAVSDGALAPEEMRHLLSLQHDLGLTTEEVAAFRVMAYLAAFGAAKATGVITVAGEQQLSAIKDFLHVTDAEIAPSIAELDHFRFLREVQAGNVPTIAVAGLITQ